MQPPSANDALRRDLEALLGAARLGQREALGRLLQGYRPYLLRIAEGELPAALRGKLGGSDVVQEALVQALACFGQFRGQSLEELQGWLRGILRNVVRHSVRRFDGTAKRQADREVPVQTLADPEAALAADGSSPSEHLMRQEREAAVREALARLPEAYRQALVWREWEGLPFAEIARRLNRSVDAARMLWWRAIERFDEEMRGSP
jgi:RNA polymerase sigma-70 factor (ECF subfamily)